ncbi:hypothetical protein ABT075_42755 [Streptomyces sp. NPDC002677]|uniref:hypothetical protein n=1 Tax=Streptomyces sp. NPDC002677 TaxID=3154774 RepID=UPI00332B7A45
MTSTPAGAVAALSAAAWFAGGAAVDEQSFSTRPYETFDMSARCRRGRPGWSR